MSLRRSVGVSNSQGREDNPFVCNICQKTYGRIDHLARHFRSHTNEKPFKCLDCGKAFARADLLKRHATIHTSTEQSGKKRKIRASQACSACAAIKVKCDQEKPCRRCHSKGLDCRVDSGPDPASNRENSHLSPVSRRTSPSTLSQQTTAQGQSVTTHQPQRQVSGPPVAYGLATPMQPSTISYPDHTYNHNVQADRDPSLTNFLNSVVRSTECAQSQPHTSSHLDWAQNTQPRDLMDFSQDLSMDFGDLDSVLNGQWNGWMDPTLMPQAFGSPTDHSHSSSVCHSSIDDSINLGAAAYDRSAWRWVPNQEKSNQDQVLASILLDSHGPDGKLPRPRQVTLTPPMESMERDRILALLLAGCDRANYQKIVALFPSTRVLDVFLNDFLLTMEHSIDSWIHIPTFKPSGTIPECLTLMIAAGAILGRSSHAQRFGYALQDKARMATHEMFESDATNTRRLSALQTYAISLSIGTWSGNKRTMELAESAALPMITMLRRAGRFRRSRKPVEPPLPTDSREQLEQKWREWVDAESFKRLAFHLFLHSVQVSVAFQTPPLLSYSEITLDLPAPAALWRARSAEEWRDQFHGHRLAGAQLPSFVSSMCDAQIMGAVRDKIDLEFTLYLVLMSHWCLAWEVTQLSSVNKAQATAELQWAGTSLAASKVQELTRLMDSFYIAIEEWRVFVPKEVHMVNQLLRMNLSVAFEDLQLLAGKEGEEEARRVLPALKQWFRSPECRQAMWHAGQVLRAARRPAGLSPNASSIATPDTPWLRDFNAVALYHAGLAFWVYGLLAKAVTIEQSYAGYPTHHVPGQGAQPFSPAIDYDGEPVHLDGNDEELTPLQRDQFISLNKGRAVISAHSTFPRGPTMHVSPSQASPRMAAQDRKPETEAALRQREIVALDDSKKVMDAMIEALTPSSCPPIARASSQAAAAVGPQRPAMVENLIQLMRDLGEAASAV